MASYQTIESFTEISLYRANGDAAFSDYATIDDVNSFQKKIRFARTPRAEPDTEDDPNLKRAVAGRTPIQVVSEQDRAFESFFPIINLTECRQCHGRSGFVRGVLHLKHARGGRRRQGKRDRRAHLLAPMIRPGRAERNGGANGRLPPAQAACIYRRASREGEAGANTRGRSSRGLYRGLRCRFWLPAHPRSIVRQERRRAP